MSDLLPKNVAAHGVRRSREVDVRTVLSRGGDPFSWIMKNARALEADEALHLIVGFEPKPLYAVMRMLGRSAHTECRGGVYHVWFYRDSGAKPEEAPRPNDERVPLREPVELDVRGLEPPAPLVAILEKLAELGPGAQLLVHHHREPVLLYDKLAPRGYAARCEKKSATHYLVRIAPAWAFPGEGGASG
jgi:uncharacterized protein (DUF2249 family)